MALFGLVFSPELRFYFKFAVLRVRSGQARIPGGFVAKGCGTRGVSLRFPAVKHLGAFAQDLYNPPIQAANSASGIPAAGA